MGDTINYYMIKLKHPVDDYKKWVGWSNSRDSLGFYITNEKQCKIFSSDVLEEDEDIKLFLNRIEYQLVPVLNIDSIRKSRVYY